MWTPSTFSQSAGARPMATHSSTPSNPLVHSSSCPIKVDPNDLWMMATDTQMSLFFSWKGEEDCCGAAWETVSMRGWVQPLIGLNFKNKPIFVTRQPSSTQIIVTWCGQAADGQPVGDRWAACFRSERIPGVIRPICWLMFACGSAGPGNGKYCCPKIYFNHRCFSGPYLNKGRIAELPQFIGPGNCVLVLKEVSGRRPLPVKARTLVAKSWWYCISSRDPPACNRR